MDTGKLLKIVDDIQKDEEKYNLQTRFQNILNYLNENNRDSLNTEKQSIEADLLKSSLSYYVESDYKILGELKLSEFFGMKSTESLNRILGGQTQDVRPDFEKYLAQRQDSFSKLGVLKSALTAFEVKPRILEDDQYEIGFLFPEKYKDLDHLDKVLKDIRNFLVSLTEGKGEDKAIKITSVNNGCFEIFLHADLNLAKHFFTALDYLLKIYAAIKMFKDSKDAIKHYSDKRKKNAEQINEEEKEDKVSQLIDEFIRVLDIKEPSKQETVKALFKRMITHLEEGLSAEVRTPVLDEPTEPDAGSDEKVQKEFEVKKRNFELKTNIDEKNKEVYVLQQNNFYGVNTKFLNTKDDSEGEEKSEKG